MDLDARRPVRGSLLGHEAARPAGQGPGQRPRHPSARRADQPPRHRRDPLARRVPAPLRRHAGVRHPRPDVPGAAGQPHRRARPGQALRLGLRLPDLPQTQGGAARGRGAPERPFRQEAGPGGGVDPQGHRGASDAQRGPGPRARRRCARPAQRRRERQGTARMQVQEAERSGTLVIEAKGVGFGYGDRAVHPRPDHDDHAGRQGRDHRPQRLGQDDAAAAPARRSAAAGGDDPPRHRAWRSPTSTS